MLASLVIDNFALIEHAELEFGPKFNVITGESGAGKSIIIGALCTLFSERADRTVIRDGSNRCDIAAVFRFEQLPPRVGPMLAALDVPERTGEIVFRKVVAGNWSRSYVNDLPVGAKAAAALARELIELPGGDDPADLTNPTRQLELLDRYAGTLEAAEVCRANAAKIAGIDADKAAFAAGLPDEAEAEHLQAIVEEIERCAPKPGEDEEIRQRYDLAANARQIAEISAHTRAAFAGDASGGEGVILDALSAVYRELTQLEHFDPTGGAKLSADCSMLIESAESLVAQIDRFADNLELDEETLAALEARLSELFTIKRRYGSTLEQVFTRFEKAQKALDEYHRAAQALADF
ncbi:MAG: AAA family ATPase, partial [Victivallaceae bacterium]|nr:AAA family ATPase [Victivallaceae bacterium]